MSSKNIQNISFMIILLLILGTTFAYITISQFTNVPIYAQLFPGKEDWILLFLLFLLHFLEFMI